MAKFTKISLFIVALAGAFTLIPFAASGVVRPEPQPLPAEYSGTMMPYDFSRTTDTPVWPDSLRPVYVAHVARHGARYISSEKKLDRLRRLIADSRASGSLTDEGRAFSSLLDTVAALSAHRWGALSDIGKEEEHRIASSLHSLLPDLLDHARIRAISSYVPRVVMTMYEFCHQLASISSGVSVTAMEGKEFDPLVRCFDNDTAYSHYRSHGPWKAEFDRAVAATVSPGPAQRILGLETRLSRRELRDVTLDMYDILQSLPAFGMPPATTRFMTAEEYRQCWQTDNLEHYLRNSISVCSSEAGRATAPLLARIIADADQSLGRMLEQSALLRAGSAPGEGNDSGPYAANLYFGHAETLMPLLSLMRVEGCYYNSPDLSALSSVWRDYSVVPLGANIDIILLSSPAGRIYAALRHNGQFVAPMGGFQNEKEETQGVSSMIVSWPAWRAYLVGQCLSR